MFSRTKRVAPAFDVPGEFWVDLMCQPGFIESRKRQLSSSISGKLSASQPTLPSPSPVSSEPSPVKELVTAAIMDEVRQRARSDKPAGSASCVVEMKWGSSRFLPAHQSGQKYKRVSSELEEILARKPVGVQTFVSEDRGKAIFDRFSNQERSLPGAVASNVSNTSAGPSRLGAFEVHVVQGTWDPTRCCPCKVDGSDRGGVHGGPACRLPGHGVICANCVARVTGSSATGESGGDLSEQHTLMHSKLWTRRWPNMRQLLKDIACAVIPPPPPRGVDFQMLQAPTIQFQPLTVIPLAAPGQMPPKKAYPEDKAVIIQKRLSALDCPAKAGWFVTGSGANICKCGGGSHSLMLDSGGDNVADLMTSLGFDKDHFLKWCASNRGRMAGQNVNAFMQHYFQSDDAAMKEKLAELNRELEQAKANIDSDHQLMKDLHDKMISEKVSIEREMEETCAKWKLAYEAGVAEARKAFVAYCVVVVHELGDGASRISNDSSVDDAESALKEVHSLNQQRWRAYQDWAQVAEAWSDVPEAFQIRPDLAGIDPSSLQNIAGEVKRISEQASANISQALAKASLASRNPYEESLKASVLTWQAAVQEFEQAKKQASK
jgi:hypothetical protein